MIRANAELMDADKAFDADEVGQIGKELVDILSGQGKGVERDPGLLITNEDVRRIHRYVKAGLELPTDLAQIKQLLGDYDIDIEALKPEAIQLLYIDIHAHATSWSGLESDMREVGGDLFGFSGSLIVTAQSVVDFIKSLDAWRTLKPDDLTPEQIALLPSIDLEEGDRKQLPGLVELVGEIKRLVTQHSGSTLRVRDGVSVFKEHLKKNLAPTVARMIQLAGSSQINETIIQLNQDIARLNGLINDKLAEYETYSKFKWLGLLDGLLGTAIELSPYGRKARKALEAKDKFSQEKRALEDQLRTLNKFIGDLHAFETSLQDLRSRMDGAFSSVSNIESLWVLLAKLVDSSQKNLDGLDDGKILVIFATRFESLISNWSSVKKQSLDLLTAFNNVIDSER